MVIQTSDADAVMRVLSDMTDKQRFIDANFSDFVAFCMSHPDIEDQETAFYEEYRLI